MQNNNLPIIIAITGASGSVYGVNLLKAFKQLDIKTMLVLSRDAITTAQYELQLSYKELTSLASEHYTNDDIAAPIASGSVLTRGMIVAPCSVKSLSSIANCYSNNLISRAADVTLKERRKLVLLFRETPLHLGHIKLMEQATLNGAIIAPPLPTFYTNPKTIDDLVNHSIARILDLFNIDNNFSPRWKE
ncbi:UbiX family flavin prenyltransferase [Rickettsiales bacterium LUAb2]